jgi:hypothetical protein
MVMAPILVMFLMMGSWALISASQQWGVRRDVHAVAAAAARAGAQADPLALRAGKVIDERAAVARAESIIAAAGYAGSVTIDGDTVSVHVTGTVRYAFPAPGFPSTVSGSATAVAVRGVSSAEGN